MPRFGSRLGTRLAAAVVGTALLAGSAVGTVAVLQARDTLRASIQSRSLAAAELAADQTLNYVTDARNDALLLASRSDIRSSVEQSDWAALVPQLRQWLDMNPHNDTVTIFDLDGMARAAGASSVTARADNAPRSVADRDWFQRVLATGQPSLGTPTASRGSGRPVVPFGVPIFATDGTLRAIMVAPISLSALSEMLLKVRVDDDSSAAIDDIQRGVILADADLSRLLQPTQSAFDTSHIRSEGERALFETNVPDGTQVLAAFAPVRDLRWGVRVYQPTSTAFAPLNEMIAKTIGLVALALVLATSFAVLLGMWITRPLHQLRTTAMAMAEGDLARRAAIRRDDEIGDMGNAFDAMAERLASTVRRLEEDVRERQRIEAQLREGQERLRAFFDAAPIGINILDASARTIQANQALQDMIGYTEEELIGRTFRDYSHSDEQKSDEIAIREMRAGGTAEIVRREKAYQHKDGHKVWVQITAATPRDEHGRPRFFVSMIENVSDKKHAESALADSEHRNRAVLNTALDGILTIDDKGRVTAANPAAEAMFDRTVHDARGRDIAELIVLDGDTSWQTSDSFVGRRLEATARRRDGSLLPVELAIAGYELRERREYTIYVRDITLRRQAEEERRQAEERLTRQALYDSLTTLPNRTLLHDRLQQAIAAARRSGEPLGLLLLDLDRFKEVNDTLGHHAGDELLQQVGVRLQEVLRASDTVGRLGGDEFAIVLPGNAEAGAVADKVLRALESPFSVEGHSVAMGASIGVAVFPDHGDDAPALLRRADVAMYNAKRTRGGFTLYSPEHDQHSLERLALLAELREAVARDELVLHYQPKVALNDRTVVGVEALVRWQHPKRGLLGPDLFIPLAEQSGVIRLLTSWILRAALQQVRAWQTVGPAVPVAVNLSPNSLQEQDLTAEIAALLEETGVSPDLLEIEITESAYMARPQAVINTLEQLRQMGVHVAIDDFGTGYSSLSYLTQLPADEVKIDRSFVRGMVDNERHATIVRSIVELGHSLGLRVVAEGLEDERTYRWLKAINCDAAQGYYLGPPAPAEELLAVLVQPDSAAA
jgi:diguanylate cyclase (GGDEF)-like protein/PAS domain S-box-containing protein